MREQGHDIHGLHDTVPCLARCLEVAILACDFPPGRQSGGRAALERVG